MRLNNFTYLFKEGTRNVLHNKLMSFASIGVLVACLLLIGSAALFSMNVNGMVRYVEQQNEVFAFLSEDLRQPQREVLDLTLVNMDNVLEIEYVSKEEFLEYRKGEMGEYAELLDGFEDDNPFLDYYVIRVVEPALMSQTVESLLATDGIVRVNASTVVAQILSDLKNSVTYAGLGVVVILVAVSVVIITNTIKITVFSRRKEINIMKYVGATDTFIRLPFLVEGMLIGLLAASFAFLILGFGYTYLMQWMGENYATQLPFIVNNAIDFWDIAPRLFAGFAGLGIFIGVVGSGVFVKKYLKV